VKPHVVARVLFGTSLSLSLSLLSGCIIRGGAAGSGGAAPPAPPGPAGAGRARPPVGPSGLPTPPVAGGVPRPSGTPGNLTVLDWAGFRAAVSYTFDDANSSQIEHYAELNALGVPLTFFLITGKPEASDPIWARAIKDGHEVSNHSRGHRQPGTGADVDAATAFLEEKLGTHVYDMAAPYGDGSYVAIASSRFLLNRGVTDGLMGPNDDTNPYALHCFIPRAGARADAFDAEIDAARAAGKWRTVLVHGFTGGTDAAYLPVPLAEFAASVEHAKSLGDVWIDTMINVGAYWRAQKMLSGVAPAAAGGVTTWTWKLPAHFPPGKYLRVRVDGGTLTQAGKPIAWDEHGYYEIALDAGALTLGP
jgi:peptidoglycan/xylan/chitin deacetylase (PgdA/CDA1 family)